MIDLVRDARGRGGRGACCATATGATSTESAHGSSSAPTAAARWSPRGVAAPTIASRHHTRGVRLRLLARRRPGRLPLVLRRRAVRRGHPDERRPRVRVRRRPAGRARRGACATRGPAGRAARGCWRGSTAAWPTSSRRHPPVPVRFFRGTARDVCVVRTEPGWALVGDAGWWKDPLSTHGITDALRDAELARRGGRRRVRRRSAPRDRAGRLPGAAGPRWRCRCTRSSTASLPTTGTSPRSAGCCASCPR